MGCQGPQPPRSRVRARVSWCSGPAGSVVNAGSISGADGIWLAAGGGIQNQHGGRISGTGALGSGFTSGAGVYITGAAGNLANSGTISGGAYGVAFGRGGTVTNSASVLGGEDGVIIQGGIGSLTNSGSIVATVDDGVALFAGGTIDNAAGGWISGAGTLGAGVFVTGGSAVVANSGTIESLNHIGVLIAAGGSLANAAGGLISGLDEGVFFEGARGELTNTGSISATGINGAGVYLENAGTVTNTAGGEVFGNRFGIFIEGGQGLLSNSGRVVASTYDGAILGLGGVILNNVGGVIIGGSNGVYAKYRAPADVTNAGSIGATAANSAGVDLADGGSVTNLPSAVITGGAFGVFITGAAGTVANNGRIDGAKSTTGSPLRGVGASPMPPARRYPAATMASISRALRPEQ